MSARVPAACLGALTVWTAVLGIAPRDRTTWWLESSLLFVTVALAVATYRKFRFSDRAYVQATVLLALHAVGSHYTYSATPIGAIVSHALGAERNHYDRFVHFMFGVLMLAPNRELFLGRTTISIARQVALAIALIVAWGALYEILEWLTAIVVDPGSGAAYLGTQGDEWDAQKDMACAGAGAAVAGVLEAIRLRRA